MIEVKNFRPKFTISAKKDLYENVDFSNFWKVWDLLQQKSLFKASGQKLLYGAISGLTQATEDPYTSFFDPDQNQAFNDGLAGEYQGIGIELGARDGRLVVIAPLEGSPAEKSGIRSGDLIDKVDGKETGQMTMGDAVGKIRGTPGTKVTLSLSRLDSGTKKTSPLEITVTREKITVPSVTWKDLGSGKIQLRLSRFGDSTNEEWRKAVDEIIKERPSLKGIVLDLRDNPGGYLAGSVYVVSEFVPAGKVVLIEEFADGTKREVKTEAGGRLLNVPLAVLINGGSASSSEITAAALRVHRGVKIVGEKSFGKGTIQDAQEFNDGSGIHITVAKWLDPKGNWYHEKGIEPDVTVEVTDKDREEGRDPQLEKAIEILGGS